MLQGIQNNSFGFNKSIVATDITGKQIEVATCYTSMVLGDTRQSLQVNITIENPMVVKQNTVQVQEQVNTFFKTVNAMAVAQGLLQIQPSDATKGDI